MQVTELIVNVVYEIKVTRYSCKKILHVRTILEDKIINSLPQFLVIRLKVDTSRLSCDLYFLIGRSVEIVRSMIFILNLFSLLII